MASEEKRLLAKLLGQELQNYRAKHDMKQKELAEKLHIEERSLRRWEAGQIPQNISELKRIADVLGIRYEQLGLSPSVYMPRSLEQIDEAITSGWTYLQLLLYREGRAFIEQLLRDLTIQITTEDQQILQRLARVRHVAGHITSESSRTENVPAAFYHYHEMEEIARILNDHTLLNIALTYEGDMLRRQGKTQEAIEYLEAARDISPEADEEARGNTLQLLARAFLVKKDMNGFENALAEAKELATTTTTGSTRGLYCLGAVYEEYGKSYGWLGQTEKALTYLDLAEKELPSTPHWHLVLKTARAMALVRSGDVTNGGNLAIEAAILCHQTNNYRMLERVYTIENYLEQKTNEYGQITTLLRSTLNGPVEQF